ncbi:MAG: zinc ribbon domain-containing protein [Clostridia bacterium]|nr:zinc ribbon domain-containing protein [Clostridia bacterium]
MPILSYECKNCGNKFEELVKWHGEAVPCPKCGAACERVWSGAVYSATGKPAKNCSGKCSECSGCK